MYTTSWPYASSLAKALWLPWDKDSQGSVTFQKNMYFLQITQSLQLAHILFQKKYAAQKPK